MGVVVEIVLLVLYSCLAGACEAVLYSKKASEAFTWNEHILFVAEMVMIGCAVCVGSYVGDRGVAVTLAWCLFHPFFHDGSYYETRRMIDVPEYRWWSNSATSTAKIEIRFWLRCIMACGGLTILFYYHG